MVRNAPRDADGFLLEPPDDGLHRLSRMGLKEDGERKWIVPLKMYDQPSVRRKWDVAPPEDLLVYTGSVAALLSSDPLLSVSLRFLRGSEAANRTR